MFWCHFPLSHCNRRHMPNSAHVFCYKIQWGLWACPVWSHRVIGKHTALVYSIESAGRTQILAAEVCIHLHITHIKGGTIPLFCQWCYPTSPNSRSPAEPSTKYICGHSRAFCEVSYFPTTTPHTSPLWTLVWPLLIKIETEQNNHHSLLAYMCDEFISSLELCLFFYLCLG